MIEVELRSDVLEKNLVRQNCSKKEMAYRMGITRSYLSGLCTGRRRASPKMRRRLLEYFHCSFDDLFVIRDGERCKTD